MHVSDEKSHTVRHYVNDEQHNLRISNHSANAVHAKFRPDEISVVIKLSSVGFVPSKEAFIAEYVYNSKSLNAEKQENILNGLKDWLNTGNYSDKSFDRDFYSPTKEQYMAHQAEQINRYNGDYGQFTLKVVTDSVESRIFAAKKNKKAEISQRISVFRIADCKKFVLFLSGIGRLKEETYVL